LNIPLDAVEITPFQRRVYEAVLQIAHGRVTTYKWLGLSIGCGSPRAIGQALRRNPLAPEVPCHRIVSSDARIGGFAGETDGPEITKKLRLLAEEGVIFEDGKLADSAQIYTFGLE
jgi:methylated-DNA-[protein]-cysteine S-methyltransferase